MKKITCVFLIFVTLITFTGCNIQGNGGASSDSVTTQAPVEDIVIASEGKSVYKIIRYVDASDEEVALFVDFKNTIKDKFNVSIDVGTDWSVPGKEPPADACEIIVGLCDRDALRNTVQKLNIGQGEYAIQICENNKIVIIAPDYSDLKLALDYFLNNLSVDDSSQLVYNGGNFYSEIEGDHIFTNADDIKLYKIVYDKDGKYKKYAEDIANAVKKNFAVELDVVSETEPKSDREIIVGVLSDKSRFSYDYSNLNEMNYCIVSSDKSILIGAQTTSTVTKAVKEFISRYIRTGNAVSLNLRSNFELTYNAFASNDTALYEGADTRIMSFNILSEEWDSAAVMTGRDVRVSAVLLNYRPDVAALQEVSNKWYNVLDDYISDVYKFTRRNIPFGSGTYTTLIYNTQTTKLIEEGIYLYSQGNSRRLRSIVWGLFESITTGERYIVCSTHWDASAGGPEVRLVQAKEMAVFVKSMQDKYGLDIFTCGDYNAKESSTEYKAFMDGSGFVDGKLAAQNIKKACNTYHNLFSELNTGSFESIDHITFSQQSASKVIFYNTLYHDYIIDASDHCPIFIDIKLSK